MRIRLFTVPNVITCLNLVSGCLAILAVCAENFLWAFLLIILAAVFDFLDGFAARLLRSYSEVGKQLDSLADVVSFGVAPGMMIFALLSFSHARSWMPYLAFIIPVFSALRLAKFNVDERQSTDFIGLPVPANALLLSSLAFCTHWGGGGYGWLLDQPWMILAIVFITSWLLVSEIPMFSLKFKGLGWKDNGLRYIFVGIAALLSSLLLADAVPLIIAVYVVLSLVFPKKKEEPQ